MGSEGTAAVIGGDVVVYEEKKGRVRLEVRLEGETPRTARAASESPADCRRWGANRRRGVAALPPRRRPSGPHHVAAGWSSSKWRRGRSGSVAFEGPSREPMHRCGRALAAPRAGVGKKKGQQHDIATAHARWKDYKQRKSQEK